MSKKTRRKRNPVVRVEGKPVVVTRQSDEFEELPMQVHKLHRGNQTVCGVRGNVRNSGVTVSPAVKCLTCWPL